MKKAIIKTIAMVLALVAVDASAQTANYGKNAAVMEGIGLKRVYYGDSALVWAYNEIGNSEYIVLSEGTFVAIPEIKRAVTVRGEGYMVDNDGNVSGTIISGETKIADQVYGAHGDISFAGMYFDSDFTYGTLESASKLSKAERAKKKSSRGMSSSFHINFDKCRLPNFSSDSYDYHKFTASNTRIAGKIYIEGMDAPTLDHCIINNIDIVDAIIDNCLILQVDDSNWGINSATINNTIFAFADYAGVFAMDQFTTCNNCLSIGGNNKIFDAAQGSGNKYANVPSSEIFASYTHDYTDYETYPLTDNAKATYLGTDGTEVGIHGGDTPYSQEVIREKITTMSVPANVFDPIALNVNINGTSDVTYWIYDDMSIKPISSGSATLSQIDATELRTGWHSIYAYVPGENPSCVHGANVFILKSMPTLASNNATPKSCVYSIDGSELDEVTMTLTNGSYQAQINCQDISLGKHDITSWIVMSDGRITAPQSAVFNRRDTEYCQTPTISYDGRYISMTTEADGVIHFTLDGSTPSAVSAVYSSKIDPQGLVTVKALTVKPEYYDSEVATLVLPSYYAGGDVAMKEAGSLEAAFKWTNTTNLEDLKVIGPVNTADLTFVKSLPAVKTIDLADAQTTAIADHALAGTNAYYVILPSSLTSAGKEIFKGSANLAAVKWCSSAKVGEDMLAGLSNNNLLLYVNSAAQAPQSHGNTVVNGVASKIVLDDSGNFLAPIAFDAHDISYSHSYAQSTPNGGCAGWESLSLPFDVETFSFAGADGDKAIAPFATFPGTDYSATKPFWLYEMSSNGFAKASSIKANMPYIISMPNNDAYADDYILSGTVTFRSDYVTVPVTVAKTVGGAGIDFKSTTIALPKSDDKATLNVGEVYRGEQPGSVFVKGYSAVSPFQAYLTGESSAILRLASLFGAGEGTSSLPASMLKDASWSVRGTKGAIIIESDTAQTVVVYSISGMAVRTVAIEQGANTIDGLAPGIYVVKNNKAIVR